ncbi:MAG TPA: hypothetical protein VGC13_20785 [Longimicrobium sp.]|jgi:hypothetical protein|uniref:hypothetical protein n=1 Tax=Longimicrobium sp. TaxID=2029185 RepID=UPI002ED981A3
MRQIRWYLIFGTAVLALVSLADYRGWAPFSNAREGQPAPRSVRDNPGAYRVHYTGSGRYVGGK